MKLLSLIILSLIAGSIHAGSIRFSPVTIQLVGDEPATSINLYNQGNDESNLQVRIFKWVQENGQDTLQETNDVVVSPPFVNLAANSSYNVRIVRISPTEISQEKSYRILIDELPKPIDNRKVNQSLNILLRSSLPLFITNPNSIAEVHWSIQQDSNNQSYLVLNNTGNRHLLMGKLVIEDTTIHVSYPIQVNTVNGYILAKEMKSYKVDNSVNLSNGHKYILSMILNGKLVNL
ncbi:molecular chaperone [Acinetobacter nectaris]|uniref:fimbrial biogenesis chaperone n=1 Tax=Acinetobacter nectaris TaxID=1219382 RepID=UPI001F00A6EA|nr:fimbria/pilus periplasmic chaperone [Acinetobacter nectaris]MCF9035493.1 molecular chaperone [Acinetobacter nectaris]